MLGFDSRLNTPLKKHFIRVEDIITASFVYLYNYITSALL